jgi:hypothetical protein
LEGIQITKWEELFGKIPHVLWEHYEREGIAAVVKVP